MPHNREESKRVIPKLVANYIPRVIVKFRDNDNKEMPPAERARIQENEIKRYEDIERNPERHLGASWLRLVEQHRGLTIQKLITSVGPQQIIKLREKARRPDRTYRPANFLTYFAVRCPSAESAQEVAETLRNHQLWPTVEGAYVEGGPALPPGVILSTNESVKQGHLDRSLANGGDPGGIDARYAWEISGGDGGGAQANLQFVDLEWGWVLGHEDLPTIPNSIPTVVGQLSGDNDSNYQGHGTGTLGVVVAVDDNLKQCVGIAPHVATTKVVSPWTLNGNTWTYSVANAIYAALALPLYHGDVLLLEVQTRNNSPIGSGYPVEIEQADFEAIKTATDAGIIVIEAAGNAGDDLDNLVANNWTSSSNGVATAIQFSLNPVNPNFQDSGAIMVGSALIVPTALASATAIPRSPNNNYGTRIDCYAWDNDIWTTGYNDPHYPMDPPSPPDPTISYFGFSGTSGASAIIAGAALAIQGIAQVNQKGDLTNGRCSPTQLRDILRNPATGTLSAKSKWNTSLNSRWDPSNVDFSTWNADRIGAMPDLKKIINDTLGITLLEPLARKREDHLIKPAKRHGGPGPKKQVSRKKPAKAKRKSPK